jgi:hypothetical protein
VPLFKFVYCLDMYLKKYLRLKFLGFCNHFLHKFYALLRFSCVICMDFVADYIFFGLYSLVICLNDLYGVFS